MAVQQAELWAHLSAFALDDPRSELTFSKRLARENGWSIHYACRVIDEYKRFIYLAMVAGHPVTPSDQVDQAWHLHLTYTESYWNDLCRDLLGRPLHHGPTRGGSAEGAKYQDWYERTKVSYQTHFGVHPPQDIWPAGSIRFGEDLTFRRVNLARNWVFPRRFPFRFLAGNSAWMAVVGIVPASFMTWVGNPLNLTGPPFLKLYFISFAISFAVALVMNRLLRNEWGEAVPQNDLMIDDPYEATYLAGGPELVVKSAVVALVRAEVIQVVPSLSGTELSISKPLPPYSHPVEKEIYDTLAQKGSQFGKRIFKERIDTIKELRKTLVSRGLHESARSLFWPRAASVLCFGPLLLLGVAKIVVGLLRDRPIGFLVMGILLTLVAMMGFAAYFPRFTKAGRRSLAKIKAMTWDAQSVSKRSNNQSLDPVLCWSIAALGLAAVVPIGDPLREMMIPSPFTSGDSGCGGSSSSDGGSGCGGGGCGGGGCGGGGCGGCGG